MTAKGPMSHSGFPQLWTATTVSYFGTYVTMVALQVLMVTDLHASAGQIGLVNAARWLPYLLFGLLAGVFVDRYRRRTVLIGSDLGRAVLLGVIPLLGLVGGLSMPVIAGLMVPFGLLALLNDAAYQSFLPRLVPPTLFNRANARLQQSSQVAQTTGPLVGGGLVQALGAPLAVVIDAVSYLGSGLILSTVRVPEPNPADHPDRPKHRLRTELREGLVTVYRHPKLASLSLNTHAWFIFSSLAGTVFVPFAVRQVGIGSFGLGIAYSCAGVGGLLGTALANRTERRMGAGPAVIAAQLLFPFAYLPIVFAQHGTGGLVLICAGQFLFWVAVGVGSPTELAYRQSVVADHLLGRANATIRSLNWGMNVIGAPIGGVLADGIGYRPALWLGIGGFAVTGVLLALSPFRKASLAERPEAGRMTAPSSMEQERADG
ncbi:MAG TPA: MFS transporter [Pseudonocardiaceae bacterium]|nr:MFS transporter [Pseudonocardiaceae bacterium]